LSSRWGLPKRLFQPASLVDLSRIPSNEVNVDKLNLRMQVYRMFPQKTVLDLFAGRGYLSSLYAPYCWRIICVEKDSEQFRFLERNMRDYKHAVLINDDNLNFLETLDESNVTYVDFDAYGCPSFQIKKFFEKNPIRQALIISVTDGMLLNFRTWSSADLSRYYLQDFYQSLGERYGDHDRYHVTRSLGEYLFEIQRRFIDILCMRYQAQANCLYFKVKPSNTVAYSAYLILPKLIGVTDFKRYVGLKELKQPTARKTSKIKITKIGRFV